MPRKEKKEVITIPPLTREEIKEFERELEDYKKSFQLEKPIEKYLNQWDDSVWDKDKLIIFNKQFGKIHLSTLQYCLFNHILSCSDPQYGYALVSGRWEKFDRKWKALKELKEARAFANRVNTPPVDLRAMKETVAKDFGPEDSLESIDNLPF